MRIERAHDVTLMSESQWNDEIEKQRMAAVANHVAGLNIELYLRGLWFGAALSALTIIAGGLWWKLLGL